jgi:hypothetical protein
LTRSVSKTSAIYLSISCIPEAGVGVIVIPVRNILAGTLGITEGSAVIIGQKTSGYLLDFTKAIRTAVCNDASLVLLCKANRFRTFGKSLIDGESGVADTVCTTNQNVILQALSLDIDFIIARLERRRLVIGTNRLKS